MNIPKPLTVAAVLLCSAIPATADSTYEKELEIHARGSSVEIKLTPAE